ncbi:hypothetical protein D3C80_1323140 [compost metagenome]
MRFAVTDQIQNVWHSLSQLMHCRYMDACSNESRRSTFCSDNFVAEIRESAQKLNCFFFIFICYSCNNRTCCRNLHSCADQTFVQCFRILRIASHNLASRFHLWSKCRLNATQLGEGEHRNFNRYLITFRPQAILVSEILQLRTQNTLRSYIRHRNVRYFAEEWYCP